MNTRVTNRNLTVDEAAKIEALINASFSVMHHDTDEADEAHAYEWETLTRKFALILFGKRL